MKQSIRFGLLICAFITTLTSCKKEFDYGLGDFRVDMATVSEFSSGKCFILDNHTILYPTKEISSTFGNGARVLINYNILEEMKTQSYTAKINSVSKVLTSEIKPLRNDTADDPLYLQSIWQSGDWINFRISINYKSTTHGIGLYQNMDPTNDTIYLELRHSKNNDANGYSVNFYASYYLKRFSKVGQYVPIKVRVNTSNLGAKHYVFDYLSQAQD